MKKHSLLSLIPPVFVFNTLGFASSSLAANFSTLSQVSLELSNFSIVPTSVDVQGNIQAIALSNGGVVDVNSEGGALFFANNSGALGTAYFLNTITGNSTDYLGQIQVFSRLKGDLLIPANSYLNFSVQATVSLNNETSDLGQFPLSTLAKMKVDFNNPITAEKFPVFDFFGLLNTNNLPGLNRDEMAVNLIPHLSLTNAQQVTLFQSNQEALQWSMTGNYSLFFATETPLFLDALTYTCNYASNVPNSCVNVPEPPQKLGLVVSILLLFALRLKQTIIKLPRKPFVK